jgi:hypothetical protein
MCSRQATESLRPRALGLHLPPLSVDEHPRSPRLYSAMRSAALRSPSGPDSRAPVMHRTSPLAAGPIAKRAPSSTQPASSARCDDDEVPTEAAKVNCPNSLSDAATDETR